MNKNISIWRGSNPPPTLNHLWIDETNNIKINVNNEWVSLLEIIQKQWDNIVTLEDTQTITGDKTFTSPINLNNYSIIKSSTNSGEFKVTHCNSEKGFIIRTNWSDDKNILPLEILSIDGDQAFHLYKFPEKSGTLLVDSDIQSFKDDINNIENNVIPKAVAEGIAEVVANAPEDLDTLKEVADYIASDKTKAAEIEVAISNLQQKDKEIMDNLGTLIINDLTTGGADKALSAEMGKALTKSSFNSPKINGYVYNYGNGSLVTTASLNGQCSTKMACLPNRLYYVKNRGLTGKRIIYWDADDTYIGQTEYNENNLIPSPSNAAYMAIFTDTTNEWEFVFIDDVTDINNIQKNIEITSKAAYATGERLNLDWTDGYRIISDGTLASNQNSFRYSSPISLGLGDRLIVYGRASTSTAVISLYVADSYKPLVLGKDSDTPEEFIYEAENDCEVVVCYLNNPSHYVARCSNELSARIAQQNRILDNIITLVKSKNLLDASKSIAGLLRGTGKVDVSSSYLTSDFIEVEPNTTYTISTSADNVYCYGEFCNNTISNYQTPNSKSITFTTLPTTNRIRITHVTSAKSVQVEKGDTATSYEPYDKPTELGTDKEGRPISVKVDIEEQFIVDHSENLLVFELFTRNGYNKWNNTYDDSKDFKTSCEVIPIEGGMTYSYKNINFISLKYFDADMNYIGVQYNPTSPFVAMNGAKYAEISLGNSSIFNNGILVKGETIPEGVKAGYFPVIHSEAKTKCKVFAKLSDKTTVQVNRWRGLKYASLGDSVTRRNQWQSIVDFHLGTTHVNLACSGMTVGGYAFHYTTGGSESGSQIGTAVADRLLNEDDFADCKLIIICGYANNFYAGSGQGTPLGSMSDGFITISESDITNYASVNAYRQSITGQSFIAACRSTVEYIQSVAPHTRIVLCGQLLMDSDFLAGWDANKIDFYRKNGQGLLTSDYSDAMKEIAEHYSLPFVDLARKGGVNNMNWHLYYSASDQVHPNFKNYVGGEDYPDSGMYKMARGIIGVLETI